MAATPTVLLLVPSLVVSVVHFYHLGGGVAGIYVTYSMIRNHDHLLKRISANPWFETVARLAHDHAVAHGQAQASCASCNGWNASCNIGVVLPVQSTGLVAGHNRLA